jgi:zinc transporter
MDDHIVCAYEIDGSGRGVPLEGAAIAQKLKADELAWVHLDAAHGDTRGWLEANVPYLDTVILDALLAEETRPRLIEFEHGAMLILRGVNLNEDASPEDMVSMRIWIDAHRIITMRIRKLKVVDDMRQRLDAGNGPKDAGSFLTFLIAQLIRRMEPTLQELDQKTDDAEEAILDKPDLALRHDIIDIRKKAIVLRRYIAPQKDVLSALRTCEWTWLSTVNRRSLQENQDRMLRFVEDLDAIRERAQIVKDELANVMADRMNRNTYVLSIVAAIFLPLGFLTGLLGINVGGMPGASSDVAFWLVWLICGGFTLFKVLKWI